MISYKRDVLERQSLSEVRWAEALQSVKECVKRLWNTLKTTFLSRCTQQGGTRRRGRKLKLQSLMRTRQDKAGQTHRNTGSNE